MSYSQFEVTDLTLTRATIEGQQTVEVEFSVANTGKLAGDKAIDLYVSDHFASDSPAVKRLKRFTRVSLGAGEKKRVKFTLNSDDFSFVNRDLEQVVEQGDFTIEVCGLKKNLSYPN